MVSRFRIFMAIMNLPSKLHIYATKEHVGVIEGSIRTVKERCRCITHTVPFKRYTKLMTTSLVECATYWLNAFLSKNGITGNISPAGIVIGCSTPDYKHTNIIFGSYAIVHTGTHNNMKRRSVPGIALGPSNEWGGGNSSCPCIPEKDYMLTTGPKCQ